MSMSVLPGVLARLATGAAVFQDPMMALATPSMAGLDQVGVQASQISSYWRGAGSGWAATSWAMAVPAKSTAGIARRASRFCIGRTPFRVVRLRIRVGGSRGGEAAISGA
jgi:hypothetical protein